MDEFCGNVIELNFEQPVNACEPIVVSSLGTTIDVKLLQFIKAVSPIDVRFELDSAMVTVVKF
jgi:hypothetical protein